MALALLVTSKLDTISGAWKFVLACSGGIGLVPTDIETLKRFYTKVHPGGIGWKPIAKQLPEVKADTGYPALFVNWAAGCFLVLCMLFSIGQFLFGSGLLGCVFVLVALLSAGVIYFNISRTDFTQD
jgi:hypothetical protein